MEQVTLCQILENFIPNDGSKCFIENGKAIIVEGHWKRYNVDQAGDQVGYLPHFVRLSFDYCSIIVRLLFDIRSISTIERNKKQIGLA